MVICHFGVSASDSRIDDLGILVSGEIAPVINLDFVWYAG